MGVDSSLSICAVYVSVGQSTGSLGEYTTATGSQQQFTEVYTESTPVQVIISIAV